MMKKRTKGRARPSFRPDSRLSAWRTVAGTRCEVTTAEVTTGSVAESTAPSRKASAQLSSGKSSFAASASRPRVSGIAITRARTGGAPVEEEQLALDEEAVGEEGDDQRQLDQVDDGRVAGVDVDRAGQRQHHPCGHREDGDREHRAPHQARERGGDRQQRAGIEKRLAEADVH